jgi:hypothetical protein
MATKINNLEYDVPFEVRYWRHPAELAIIHDVYHSTMYTRIYTPVPVIKLSKLQFLNFYKN